MKLHGVSCTRASQERGVGVDADQPDQLTRTECISNRKFSFVGAGAETAGDEEREYPDKEAQTKDTQE